MFFDVLPASGIFVRVEVRAIAGPSMRYGDDFGLIAAGVFVVGVAVFLYCEFGDVVIGWVVGFH